MSVYHYQYFHKEKWPSESHDEFGVNVDNGTQVGALVHVANVSNFDL